MMKLLIYKTIISRFIERGVSKCDDNYCKFVIFYVHFGRVTHGPLRPWAFCDVMVKCVLRKYALVTLSCLYTTSLFEMLLSNTDEVPEPRLHIHTFFFNN